jgi:hypothetical protein
MDIILLYQYSRCLDPFSHFTFGVSSHNLKQQILQLPYNCPYLLYAFETKLVTINCVGEYLIHKWTFKNEQQRQQQQQSGKNSPLFQECHIKSHNSLFLHL